MYRIFYTIHRAMESIEEFYSLWRSHPMIQDKALHSKRMSMKIALITGTNRVGNLCHHLPIDKRKKAFIGASLVAIRSD